MGITDQKNKHLPFQIFNLFSQKTILNKLNLTLPSNIYFVTKAINNPDAVIIINESISIKIIIKSISPLIYTNTHKIKTNAAITLKIKTPFIFNLKYFSFRMHNIQNKGIK